MNLYVLEARKICKSVTIYKGFNRQDWILEKDLFFDFSQIWCPCPTFCNSHKEVLDFIYLPFASSKSLTATLVKNQIRKEVVVEKNKMPEKISWMDTNLALSEL